MTGAASDLRPGLSAQMVEIHEPVRILFIVQTTETIMHRIISSNLAIKKLVEGAWVQLAIYDAGKIWCDFTTKDSFETIRHRPSRFPRSSIPSNGFKAKERILVSQPLSLAGPT